MIAAVMALLAVTTTSPDSSRVRVVDRFEELGAWSAHPADGVSLALHTDRGHTGRAMRLDFNFPGGGYAIARRMTSLDLPANYAFSFWIRGQAAPNTLEFKLIDKSGDNVWWYTERDRTFDGGWHQITIRRRQVAFAWGPKGGGNIDHVAALELVITAGRGGGKGSVWFDDLTLTELPESGPYNLIPVARASASRAGHVVASLLDGDTATSWRAPGPTASVTVDFRKSREFGGISLFWEPGRAPLRYRVNASDDGVHWTLLGSRQRGGGSVDHLYLPDAQARYLRFDLNSGPGNLGFGLREVRIDPLEAAASRNAFFGLVAHDAPRGAFPRYFAGERGDWTVVGIDGAMDEALINDDGAIEPGSGAFSVEPFLRANGRFLSWNDVVSSVSLEQQRLPIPTVTWQAGALSLAVTAFARGTSGASSVVARYRVSNHGTAAVHGTLYLAIRPFQVNPPWQFLGTPGGVSRIDSLRWDGGRVRVNADRSVSPLTAAARFGAVPFAAGDIVDLLRTGVFPQQSSARDSFGAASGALSWAVDLAPGASATYAIEIPLNSPPLATLATQTAAGVDSALGHASDLWQTTVDRGTIGLPASGSRVSNTIASTLGYILINRDGAAIQPGSRSYDRSWIRDGALTSTALLRFGHADVVRDFLLWFAKYQYPNGKVPCCVDRRGADPVAEYDSQGEFIYLVAEYYRHTGDRAVVEQLWPKVNAAVTYLDSLRQSERTPEYRVGPNRFYFGLLPPSISHEGYSAKPMHSYWDDFFALRGFKDAAMMATMLGRSTDAVRIGGIRDEFAAELFRSIAAVMADRQIDYLPGAADLGDFDATSTTIALTPVEELPRLPRAAVERTFERYWQNASARRNPAAVWEAYTPYELRTVGAMLRLGWKDRALTMLNDFLADQSPPAWNQWPEVVWHDRHAPKFIGDLPHTWVGSDFLRSASDLFVYERETDSALVIGAGITEEWLTGTGVSVRNLSTWWGSLSYTVKRENGAATMRIAAGIRVPAGGLVVHQPGSAKFTRITVNGQPAIIASDGTVIIRSTPALIVFAP